MSSRLVIENDGLVTAHLFYEQKLYILLIISRAYISHSVLEGVVTAKKPRTSEAT
jgi:hypothetical protein